MATTSQYTIKNTQGTLSFTINVGSASGPLESTQNADLTFYGYGRTGWGQEVDQNFYRLLENFACAELTSSPAVPKTKVQLGGILGINKPIVGQQWFNITTNEMYVCANDITNTWKHLTSSDYIAANYLSSSTAGTTYLRLDGSNSPTTGFITLNAAPTAALHAATKGYVDTADTSVLSTVNGAYVHKAGDTMTGSLSLTVTSDPTAYIYASINTSTPGHPNAGIEFGNHDSVTSTPFLLFNSSGSNITNAYDTLIHSTGGTIGVNGQGTLTLYGFIVDDGRAPTLANQLVHKSWVDTSISNAIAAVTSSSSSLYVRKSGDTMSGQLNMAGSKIINVPEPTGVSDPATKNYVDTRAYAPAGLGASHQIIISYGGPGGYSDGDIWFQL